MMTQRRQLLHVHTIRHATHPTNLEFESACALTLSIGPDHTIVGW